MSVMCNICKICGERQATKTNSHIVPSFLIASFTSYNGSGKRDTEVMFTITNSEDSVYTGRSVSGTKIDQLFDKDNLTEERIREELSNNTVAKDYIFCPKCEKKLADLLESPYAQYSKDCKTIENDIPLFFWLSVVWRMSITKDYGFDLGDDLDEILRLYLKSYFDVKERNLDVSETVEKVPFRYKLLRCKDFCKNNSGFLYAKFENGVLDLLVGEYLLRASFNLYGEFSNPPFMGAETQYAKVSINHGTSTEQFVSLEEDALKAINYDFIQKVASLKAKEIEFQLDWIWGKIGQSGTMPIELKEQFLKNYSDDNVKIGDRHGKERSAKVLFSILSDYFRMKKR